MSTSTVFVVSGSIVFPAASLKPETSYVPGFQLLPSEIACSSSSLKVKVPDQVVFPLLQLVPEMV